ncbi:MAG: sigma-70 family RNA polymerase sigma factor [Planctomycetes bacterium]|nr:sigma-70 family RNA polymerase sigma factor [Planctomycetota bacterium]
MTHGAHELVEHLFRTESGRMTAALVRILGARRIELAEEAVQEALVRALRAWPLAGVPRNPSAWLVASARNAALDQLRRERSQSPADREPGELGEVADGELDQLAAWTARAGQSYELVLDDEIADDTLQMMFLCCHPDVPPDARATLILKTVGGFHVSEIARAYLANEGAIAQRLVRAKQRLASGGPSFEWPSGRELVERLDAVLEALYLAFNEGYAALRGEELLRADLMREALRLASLLAAHPATRGPKVDALTALMCLQASRSRARVDDRGNVLLLEDQDRALWDQALIARGFRHLERAMVAHELSEYHVEAGLAACHAAAPSFAETRWERIVFFYDAALERADSPLVRLNRAVAIAMRDGVWAGLAELDALDGDPQLARFYLFFAVRGELLRRAGRFERAAADFERALELPCSAPERELTQRRRAACRPSAASRAESI